MSKTRTSFAKGEKNPGKTFEKGKSGNPGGRPRTVKEVQELAREQTVPSIEALAANLKDESGAIRNAAAEALLNRGWGKAPQVIEGDVTVKVIITGVRRDGDA